MSKDIRWMVFSYPIMGILIVGTIVTWTKNQTVSLIYLTGAAIICVIEALSKRIEKGNMLRERT